MSHTRYEETIAAYAIDALDGSSGLDERDILEHLAGCEDCRALFRDLKEVAGDLALAAPPVAVTREMEERLMLAVRDEPAPSTAPAAPRQRARRLDWLARAAAVVAIVTAGALGLWGADVRSDLRETKAALAIVNDSTSLRATLTPAKGHAGGGTVAIAQDGRAVLVASGFKSLPEGKVFELWLMRGGVPRAAGVFRSAGDTLVLPFSVEPGDYEAAAVTVEDGPDGAQAPTTPQIYSGALA